MHTDWKLMEGVYRKALVPNMIAILGGTINVFFDGILVGQRMGETGISSVNQSMPVYLLLCMIGSLVASGASALSAAAIGDRRGQDGKDYYSLAVELALVFGLILCVLGFVFSAPVSRLLGSEDTWQMVATYIRITFLCGVFKIMLYIPYFYLRLEGLTKQSAASMLTMAVLNIVFDYLFLFVFDLGIAGAAWASNLATVIACVMAFIFLAREQTTFSFSPLIPDRKKVVRIVKTGSPMALNNLLSSVRLLCLNSIMNIAGGSSMVAAFAITNNINEFSICVQNGVPQAGSAMMGIYYGEKDTVSVKKLLNMELRTGALCSAIFALVLILFRGQVGLLFGSSQDVSFPVICLAIGIILGTINNIMIYYYCATMRPIFADILTVVRVLLAAVPAAWLLRGSSGIWTFYWIAEIIVSLIWLSAGLRKSGIYMLDESDVNEGRSINFTVNCDTADICEASEKIQDFCVSTGFDENQTMTISLAVEELLVITAGKSMDNNGTMDVRLLKLPDSGILRIRSAGRPYNPLESADDSLEYLGVNMIMKMAKKTEYQSTLGLNTLIVYI